MSSAAAGELDKRVSAALERRREAGLGVRETATAFRLIHGRWDGLDDVFVNRLGDTDVVRLRHAVWWNDPDAVDALTDTLAAHGATGIRVIVDEQAKHAERSKADLEEALNERVAERGLAAPDEGFVVYESGRALEMSVVEGFSQGLFLDMREVRRELAETWHGRRIANLFAYTCGFGVFLAPTNEVVNVDVSKRYLAWGRRNYELNDLPTKGAFVAKDAFDYLEFAHKRDLKWDGIVLDPPVFSRGKKGRSRRFTLRKDLGPLIEMALEVLSDDGELFVSTNYAGLTPDTFDALVSSIAQTRGFRVAQKWGPAPDFPAPADTYHLKTARVARA